jgi:RimJ/RimL family protein N-acetyltransferase
MKTVPARDAHSLCLDTKAGAIIVRPPEKGDLNAVISIHADPRTNPHNPAGPVRSAAAAEGLLSGGIDDWQRSGIGYWTITGQNSEILGFGGARVLEVADRELLNLYYRLAPAVWGQGIATVVARRAVSWAHENRPQLPIIARLQPGHEASERTSLRAGLTRAGDDPWGRKVLADRPLDPNLLAALPKH